MTQSVEFAGDPLVRWRVGHHVFLVIIQGLLLCLEELGRAAAASEWLRVGKALQRAATLFSGARAALLFAGDIGPLGYTVVRPSMMNAHPQFSGLMDEDHQALVSRLAALRPLFRGLPAELTEAHHVFSGAMESCIAAHIHVCEKFAKGGPSLHGGVHSDTNSIEALSRMGQSRLDLVRPQLQDPMK